MRDKSPAQLNTKTNGKYTIKHDGWNTYHKLGWMMTTGSLFDLASYVLKEIVVEPKGLTLDDLDLTEWTDLLQFVLDFSQEQAHVLLEKMGIEL